MSVKLDGLVKAIIRKLDVEELESDCGVHVENILQEELDAGNVQSPNELLRVSVRCEFAHDAIQSSLQYHIYSVLDMDCSGE
jgi:hypothetical protein